MAVFTSGRIRDEFLAREPSIRANIDVWASEQGMLQTFSDPAFQTEFLALFEGPPTVRVYRSTDFHQWYQP